MLGNHHYLYHSSHQCNWAVAQGSGVKHRTVIKWTILCWQNAPFHCWTSSGEELYCVWPMSVAEMWVVVNVYKVYVVLKCIVQSLSSLCGVLTDVLFVLWFEESNHTHQSHTLILYISFSPSSPLPPSPLPLPLPPLPLPWSSSNAEPINIFHGVYKNDNSPIRLSYHGNVHYNSVVDPYEPSVGVGLGLAGYKPGVSARRCMVEL